MPRNMKKIKALFMILTLMLCLIGCSDSENSRKSEDNSEVKNTKVLTEELTECKTEEQAEFESSIVSTEEMNLQNFEGNIIKMREYGSIKIPEGWSFINEPESERPAIYYGNEDNMMIVFNLGKEDIKACAEAQLEIAQKHHDDVRISDFEIDGHEAYRICYNRDGESVNEYVFSCTDGVNRNIIFYGDEALSLADSIVKTYHLYN